MVSIKMDEVVEMLMDWGILGCEDWSFCSWKLSHECEINIKPMHIKNRVVRFFKKVTGYKVYTECPVCKEGEIVPRKSRFGIFVGCSKYPVCKFVGKRIMSVCYENSDEDDDFG